MKLSELRESIRQKINAYELHSGMYVSNVHIERIGYDPFDGKDQSVRVLRIETEPPPGEIS